MRKLLAALLLASLAPAANANPMLELCLPLAPKVCALTKESPQDDYLSCFENVMLSVSKPKERACASELLHARVHKACAADITAVCAGVKPGDNRTMSCLGRNKTKLAKPCADAYGEYMKLENSDATKGGMRKKGRGAGGISAVRC